MKNNDLNENRTFIIKGDICFSVDKNRLETVQNGYLVCQDGICCGVFRRMEDTGQGACQANQQAPEDAFVQEWVPEFAHDFPLLDYTGKLVMPGMIDLHIHGPQYAFRGMGMDCELMDWLSVYAFPEEMRYKNAEYARCMYSFFADRMKRSATTRAVIFATAHRESTEILMDLMEETGLVSYVGKVNMDALGPEGLKEASAEESIKETEAWLENVDGRYDRTMPILTPRFLPACSRELLKGLAKIRLMSELPVQSHLSENPSEIETVRNLFNEADFYGDGYDRFRLFGEDRKSFKTVMAHCVYSGDEELKLIREHGVYVAHCPASNMNLSSGIAPVKKFLDMGLNVGLGSDVAGGESESVFQAIVDSIKVSKLHWRLVDNGLKPLDFKEAFYMATLGGGGFFGRVGSFREGYELDCIVVDDSSLHADMSALTEKEKGGAGHSLLNRLEQAVYLRADQMHIVDKFVQGMKCEIGQ